MWGVRTAAAAAIAATSLVACGATVVENVAAAGNHTCVRFGRDVYCFGDGTSRPKRLEAEHVTGICAGRGFACGRREDGRVFCGPALPGATLTRVPGILRAYSIACGGAGGCILDFEGVHCWDWTETGAGPVALAFPHADPFAVTVGASHRCAITAGRDLYCWGQNGRGQLGVDPASVPESATPVHLASLPNVADVAAGGEHTCAISNGHVHCFGKNDHGQLGRADPGTFEPSPVQGMDQAVRVAAGARFACAQRADGAVSCWGDNGFGQLGDGTTDNRSTPVRVEGLADVVELALGDSHSCARIDGGTAQCWGGNRDGQLGDGTFGDRTRPTAVQRPE